MNIPLNISVTDAAELVTVLKQARDQAHAWMKAKHSTDEERQESEARFVLIQGVIDQLERA